MRASIRLSAASLWILPALLLVCAPWGCGGDGDANQTAAAGQTTASTASGTAGAGGTGAAGATGAGGTAGGGGAVGTGGATSSAGAASGGAGPGSGGASGSTTTGSMSGSGGGSPCMGMGGCDPGFYCNAPGCGTGTCAQKPGIAEQQKDRALVCGCDNVTYWNESIAAYQGVGVKAMGTCLVGSGIACSQATPCPSGLRCNRKALSDMTCNTTPNGECWGMPIACDPIGPTGHACSNGQCASECVLIQSQNPWYDGPCP